MQSKLYRITAADNQISFVVAQNPAIAAGVYVTGEMTKHLTSPAFTIADWASQLPENERQGLQELLSVRLTGFATFDAQESFWVLSQLY